MSGELPTEGIDLVNLVTVSSANWDAVVKTSELPVVVNFWAPWCPHSEKLTATFQSLSQRFVGRMKFARVNTDENKDLAARFGIMSVPTLLYFYQGRPYFQVIGDAPKHQLESEMDHILAQHKRCLSRSSERPE
jgi:thioredoxin 1